jgi:hypothetical protein
MLAPPPRDADGDAPPGAAPDALCQPTCLLSVLGQLECARDLCSALMVCQLWRSVAEMPVLWEQLYERLHGAPAPRERTPRCRHRRAPARSCPACRPPSPA